MIKNGDGPRAPMKPGSLVALRKAKHQIDTLRGVDKSTETSGRPATSKAMPRTTTFGTKGDINYHVACSFMQIKSLDNALTLRGSSVGPDEGAIV